VQKLAAMSRQRGNANRTQKGKEAFDWIQDVMQLIVQLLNVLSQTVKSWEYFRSSRGGISYFESFGCPELQKRTHMALRNINLVFEDLQSCRDRLDSLNKTCQSSADAVSSIYLLLILALFGHSEHK
jgi:hypothetical protein